MCCGTKRLVEIQCPADCGYLAVAREHPAAVVRRRQEHDVSRLLPSIRHLTERQYQLFFLFHTLIARHKPQGFTRLVDSDIAEAAGSLAATLETAARGVIYDREPQAPSARALSAEMKAMLAEMREQGGVVYDSETATVLRAIEQGAQALKEPGEGDAANMDLIARLLQFSATPQSTTDAPTSALILP